MGKTLVVYYSQTGTCKKLAEAIAAKNGCDIEELCAGGKKSSFIANIFKMIANNRNNLGELKFKPSGYGKVVIVTPVWGANVPPAIGGYITKFAHDLAGFTLVTVFKGSGGEATKNYIEQTLKVKVSDAHYILQKDVLSGEAMKKLNLNL